MTNQTSDPGDGPALPLRQFASMLSGSAAFALRRFYADASLQAASSLTYTTLLSLVPLLAIAFAIFAAFPAFEGAREQLEAAVFENLVPGVGGDIQAHLTGFLENAGQLGTVGVVGLGLSALLLLGTIEATFNRIWRVDRLRPLVVRFLLYWGVLTLGPLLIGAGITLTTDVFSVARQGLDQAGLDATQFSMEAGGFGDQIWSTLLQTVLFTVLFIVVPNRRIAWRDALIGGAVSGIGFQLLKIGFAWYLANVFTYQAIYGAMAAFPIFLIWLYLSWCVILLGATFAASVPEWVVARGVSLGDEDGPGATLADALRILAVLKHASRDGGQTTTERLAATVRSGDPEPVLSALLDHDFAQTTTSGGLVLARDLEVSTVFDLYQCLGLTASRIEHDTSPFSDDATIDGVITALDAAERNALDQPLDQIVRSIHQDVGNQQAGVKSTEP